MIQARSRRWSRRFSDYFDENRGTLDRSKENSKQKIQKISGILKPLAAFFRDCGTVYMKDVKTEHLSAFQQTCRGRLRKNRETDEFIRQPKSQLGKRKNQEFLKMFFRGSHRGRFEPDRSNHKTGGNLRVRSVEFHSVRPNRIVRRNGSNAGSGARP